MKVYAEDIRWLASALSQADILLWDRQMFDFAVKGQRLFYGIVVPNNIAFRSPEIWLQNFDLRQHPGSKQAQMPQLTFVIPDSEGNLMDWWIHFRPDGEVGAPLIDVIDILKPGQVHPDPFQAVEPIPCPDAMGVITMARIEFLKSTIVASDKEIFSRRIRRQAEQADKHEPIVRVIHLRRKEQNRNAESGGTIDYSCQWLVRPHWRNQYHPSTGERKPVFIDAYIKGPEDKPFKPPKDYVFKVDR
jgi:hypothetical protein